MNKLSHRSLRFLVILLLLAGAVFLLAHGASAQDTADTGAPVGPGPRPGAQHPPDDHRQRPAGHRDLVRDPGRVDHDGYLRDPKHHDPAQRTPRAPAAGQSLQQVIGAGNYQEAWEICNANRNYLANTLKAGLERIGRGKDVFDDALAEHGLREAQILRTRNSYLSVIGVVSPMIGLLGTVIGMMKAFTVLGGSGISDPRALASSIGEVLLATASGLFIAIPAFVFYYIFRNRAQAAIVNAEDQHQLAGGGRAFRRTSGRAHRREFLRRRGCQPWRTPFPPRLAGADDQLPRVQRARSPPARTPARTAAPRSIGQQ